jgi:hypothetical protein
VIHAGGWKVSVECNYINECTAVFRLLVFYLGNMKGTQFVYYNRGSQVEACISACVQT